MGGKNQPNAGSVLLLLEPGRPLGLLDSVVSEVGFHGATPETTRSLHVPPRLIFTHHSSLPKAIVFTVKYEGCDSVYQASQFIGTAFYIPPELNLTK